MAVLTSSLPVSLPRVPRRGGDPQGGKLPESRAEHFVLLINGFNITIDLSGQFCYKIR
jgi:hypothetical protein